MKLSLKLTTAITAILVLAVSDQASAITVVSNAIEDAQFIGQNQTNRNELILNDSGTNRARYGAVRFDIDILGGNGSGAPAFTDSSRFSLVSATLRLTEQASRTVDPNPDNGNFSRVGSVGAYFFNTVENSDWTIADLNSIDSGNAGAGADGTGWFGNSQARNGNFGGTTAEVPGVSNLDERSNGFAPLGVSDTGDNIGVALTAHTFDPIDDAETVDIDLTTGGASLFDIQGILADWVAGDNAGIGLRAEFGNQSFFQSNGVAAGQSVGSTIDDDDEYSGVSADVGLGANGPGTGTAGNGTISLTLEFEEFNGFRGDFDNDLAVNVADYALWRDSIGSATDAAISDNGDNTAGVSLNDYTVWQLNFGNTAPGAVASAVAAPEPSAVILLATLIGGVAVGARTRV